MSPRVHIWVPDYASAPGGLQVFSRFVIRAVAEGLSCGRLSVLSKNDRSAAAVSELPHIEFHSSGRWPGALRTPAFACQLVVQARRQRPDLILTTHVNFTPVARWLKRRLGIPYVAVAHGVDVWGLRRRDRVRGLRQADQVWAVSRHTRERLLGELQLRPQQVKLLPNTFDADRFAPAQKPAYLLKRHNLSESHRVILTVARLASQERYKGYDQVLRALPAIRRCVPAVRYMIAGTGPDRGRVEALVRQLGLEEAVILAGYVPDTELCDYYNLCDVFAMPSKGEGFGIVFLEALACGKPVLAGNQDGSVDALLDGELGVLVEPDNLSAIADNLIAMLTGRHPLAILREPDRLRARLTETYGYARFVERVAGHLAQLEETLNAETLKAERHKAGKWFPAGSTHGGADGQ